MTLSILLSKLHYWEQIQREVQKEIKRQGEANGDPGGQSL